MRSDVSRPRSVSPALCADAANAETIIIPATSGKCERFNIFRPACLRSPIFGRRNPTLATAVRPRQARILLKTWQGLTPDDRGLADLGDRPAPAMVGDMASGSGLTVRGSMPRMIERDPEFLCGKAILVPDAELRRRIVVQGGHLMMGCGRHMMIRLDLSVFFRAKVSRRGNDPAVQIPLRAGRPDQIVARVVGVGLSAAIEGAQRVTIGNERLKRCTVGRAAGAIMAGCRSVVCRGLDMMRRS
jgi:hypothetical protein